MQVIDLFSGIGGFSLAGRWVSWQTVQFCEINKFCQKILKKNFPEIPIHDDIRTLTYETIKKGGLWKPSEPTIVVGGFPCQSFSIAGKGATDLTLWKEMYRTITEIKPPYVVAENVPGIISRKNGMAFNTVCSDLENYGYEVLPLNIPIAGKGAPHKRERIWFIAYSGRFRCENEQEKNRQTICNEKRNCEIENQSGEQQCRVSKSDNDFANSDSSVRSWDLEKQEKHKEPEGSISNITYTDGKRLQGQRKHRGQLHTKPNKEKKINRTFNENQFKESWYEVATRLCRMDDGIPNRVDRIMALGNSISPILAYEFFKCINEINNMTAKYN